MRKLFRWFLMASVPVLIVAALANPRNRDADALPTLAVLGTAEATATIAPSATITETATVTPSATITETATVTPSATITETPTPTATIIPPTVTDRPLPTSPPVATRAVQIVPRNCSTAVAMGLSAVEAARHSHLDRDNDGVACYGD